MKLKTKNNYKNKAPLIIIAAVVLALVVGGAAFAYYTVSNNTQTEQDDSINEPKGVDYNPATDEQVQSGQDIKEEFNDKAYEDDPAQPTKVDVTVTNHGVEGGLYKVRTMISVDTSTGSCTLKLSSNGQADITKTSNVQSLGSYSVCSSYFDIPVADLGAAKWQAILSYEGVAKGSTTFEVQVK